MNDNLRVVSFVIRQPVQGMLKYWQIQRVIAGKFGWPHKWRFSAILSGSFRNFFIIRRDNHSCDVFGLQTCSNAVSDQRVPGK